MSNLTIQLKYVAGEGATWAVSAKAVLSKSSSPSSSGTAVAKDPVLVDVSEIHV